MRPAMPILAIALIWSAAVNTGCGSRGSAAPRSQVNQLADEYVARFSETYPIGALFSGIPDSPNDRLDQNSLVARAAWEAQEDRWMSALNRVPAEAVRGGREEVTYGILHEILAASIQSRICRRELWPLDQQNGFQIAIPIVGQLQPLGTSKLRAEALARWRGIPGYIDTEVANLREGVRLGYTQPRGNVEAVIQELTDLLKLPAERSPFTALAERDSAPGFRDSVVAVVRDAVLPAINRYRTYLVSEYAPRARVATALAALPHGAECYRALVRANTTLDLDPDSVYRLGQAEMVALTSQMQPIAQRLFGTRDLAVVFDRFRADSTLSFGSREEIIRVAKAAVDRARTAAPKWFGRLPGGTVVVDPCLPFEESSGCPNSYVPGTPDGARPGRWRINARVEPRQPRAPLEGTAFHETIPGHHLQVTIALERTDLHPIARYFGFSGFTEGWALYAERLGLEMGIYSSDSARFGELGEQSLRAARLLVDPGLHAKGWSRRQAIEYMRAHTMYDEVTIESEVDRYIANPGQATAYLVGRHEIDRLRQLAEQRLGPRFDIREFHDRVLESGAVPLSLLRSHIEAWLAQH